MLLACLVAAGAVAVSAATASARTAQQSAITDAEVSSLDDQGGYIWSPVLATQGTVEIVISLPEQRALVYRNGVRIGASAVSTGTEGRETPTGVFPILEKERFHRSSKYNDAPMPYMQRLTWEGVALHGGPLPGYAASHGCIRLPLAFARDLFGVTSVGTTVVVTDGGPDATQPTESSSPAPSDDGEPAMENPEGTQPQTEPDPP